MSIELQSPFPSQSIQQNSRHQVDRIWYGYNMVQHVWYIEKVDLRFFGTLIWYKLLLVPRPIGPFRSPCCVESVSWMRTWPTRRWPVNQVMKHVVTCFKRTFFGPKHVIFGQHVHGFQVFHSLKNLFRNSLGLKVFDQANMSGTTMTVLMLDSWSLRTWHASAVAFQAGASMAWCSWVISRRQCVYSGKNL